MADDGIPSGITSGQIKYELGFGQSTGPIELGRVLENGPIMASMPIQRGRNLPPPREKKTKGRKTQIYYYYY